MWWKLGVLAGLAAACAPISPRVDGNRPVPPPAPLDADGVRMLQPSAPGVTFRLGTADPNHLARFEIEKRTVAVAGREGPLAFWNVAAHDLEYASGGQGKTIRLHIYSGDDPQRFTWRTQRGYLSTPGDLRNVELTVYLRVHGITDPRRAAVSLKVRGGKHTAEDPDRASCVMLTFQAASTGAPARFGKELSHPDYDYVKLTPHSDAALTDGLWVGLKMVSYAQHGQVVNRLYVDTDPWDARGRPTNHWALHGDYVDVEGRSTGRYTKLADWGGWVTTVRSDGVENLDFAILSAREISPPT
jgi:hypothetical protein